MKNNEQLKKIKIEGKESFDELKEMYFGFKRDLLELSLNACKEVVANYSFKKKILKRNIAYLKMMMFVMREKELGSVIIKHLNQLKNTNNIDKQDIVFSKKYNENIDEFSEVK